MCRSLSVALALRYPEVTALPDFAAIFEALRQVCWDAPYRVAACLLGLTLTVRGTPGDTLIRWTETLGLHVGSHVTAVSDWLNDPSRRDGAVTLGVILLAVGVGATLAHGLNHYGWQQVTIGGTRASATTLVGAALLTEVHAFWSLALWISLLAAVLAIPVLLWVQREETNLCLMLQGYAAETIVAVFWMPLTILAWSAGRESRRPSMG